MTASEIIALTRQCQDIFAQLNREASSSDVREWIEVQTKELNLWARTLGVFADGDYNIQYRLADNKQVTSVIISLLTALRDHLYIYYSTLTNKQYPGISDTTSSNDESPDDSDDSSDSSEETIGQRAEKIEGNLGRLGRLAIRLRRDGAARAAQAALDFEPVDNDKAKTPLAPLFEDYVKTTLARSFDPLENLSRHVTTGKQPWPQAQPDAPLAEVADKPPPFVVDQYLRDRLKETMMRRWKRICYNRHHASGLAGTVNNKSQARQDAEKAKPKAAIPDQKPAIKPSETPKQQPPSRPTPAAKAASTATKLAADVTIESKVDLEHQATKSVVTKVKAGSLPFPIAPVVAKGAQFFGCTLCGKLQNTDLLRTTQWRIHAMHDLEPYICLFPDCSSGFTTYTSYDDWISHVTSAHSKTFWTCNECPTAHNTFHDARLYEQHFAAAHPDQNITSEEISLLVTRFAKKQAPLYSQCYFCGFIPEAYLDRPSCPEAQEMIIEHMSKTHMQYFALSCLPWDFAGAGGDGESSFQPAASSGIESDEARLAIMEDDELLPDGSDNDSKGLSSEIPAAGAKSIVASLAEIRKRWDSTLSTTNRTESWVSQLPDKFSSPEEGATAADEDDALTRRGSATQDVNPGFPALKIRDDSDPSADGSLPPGELGGNEDSFRKLLALINQRDATAISAFLQDQPPSFYQDVPFHRDYQLPFHGLLMHTAVSTGSLPCVSALLSLGRDDELPGLGTAVALAVRLDHHEISELLLKNDFRARGSYRTHTTALAYAIAQGSLEVVKSLVNHDIDQTEAFQDIFFDFDEYLDRLDLKQITDGPPPRVPPPLRIRSGALPAEIVNVEGPATFLAAIYEREDVLRYLIECKYPINSSAKIRRRDISLGADEENERKDDQVSANGEKPYWTVPLLSWCAYNNRIKIVEALLELGADPTMVDDDGDDALANAADGGCIESLEIIYRHVKSATTMQQQLDNALRVACRANVLESVKWLIAHGAAINAENPMGSDAPLIIACRAGLPMIVEFLIESGADIETTDVDGDGCLAITCFETEFEAQLAVVEVLIRRGAQINARSNTQRTPLMHAATRAEPDCMNLLLAHGANATDEDEDGDTALHYAARYDRCENVDILLSKGAELEKVGWFGRTPLLAAIRESCEAAGLKLIDLGADIHAEDQEMVPPLIEASIQSLVETVKRLVAMGAKIEHRQDRGRTALYEACSFGRMEVIEVLLDAGANPEAESTIGLTPVLVACREGHAAVVKLLIERGARLNFEDDSLLMDVVSSGYNECLELLIEANPTKEARIEIWEPALFAAVDNNSASCLPTLLSRASHNVTNAVGDTPLIVAVRKCAHDCMNILVQQKASTEVRDRQGLAPLHIAAKKLCTDCLNILLDAGGADVNARNAEGMPAIVDIAGCSDAPSHIKHIESMRCLIKHGADVHARHLGGRTSLIIAAKFGCCSEVELLIDAGSDLDAVDNFGQTALMVSSTPYKTDRLVEAGADIAIRDLDGHSAYDLALMNLEFEKARSLSNAGATVNHQRLPMAELRMIERAFSLMMMHVGEELTTDDRRLAASRRSELILYLADSADLSIPASLLKLSHIDRLHDISSKVRARLAARDRKRVTFQGGATPGDSVDDTDDEDGAGSDTAAGDEVSDDES